MPMQSEPDPTQAANTDSSPEKTRLTPPRLKKPASMSNIDTGSEAASPKKLLPTPITPSIKRDLGSRSVISSSKPDLGDTKDLDNVWGNDFVTPQTELDHLNVRQELDRLLIAACDIIDVDPDERLKLCDVLVYYKKCNEDILEDDFSLCFMRKYMARWNWNAYLFFFWCCGVFIRYCILVPLRVILLLISWTICFVMMRVWAETFKDDPKKQEEWELWTLRWMIQWLIIVNFGVVNYHGQLPLKKANQIYVANHSTMLDVMFPSTIAPFCLVGQKHSKPFIAFIQEKVLKSLNCIWFDRKEKSDRSLAAKRIKDHVADASNPRLLIFPEGTCVNNETTVQFKRGVFGLDVEICPIAIKYNKTFSDMYWISRERPFHWHMFDVFCNWCIVADIYWLEPQRRRNGETAEEFAERVQRLISKTAGLKFTTWNGYLKHYKPSQRVKEAPRKQYSRMLESKLRRYEEGVEHIKRRGTTE